MHTLKASDGLELRYEVDDYTDPWREADTVLLLHAAMGSSRRFRAWVPHLARDYRLVRLDQRGHGESGRPGPDQLSFERLMLDAVELLDHLGVDRAHVAGASAGGIVSQGLAIHHPARVRTLASFAATPGMKKVDTDYSGWVARIGRNGVAAFLRETIADRIDVKTADPGFVDWFIAESARTPVEVLARFVPMMAGVDLQDQLPRIACPMLVVVPGADPLHPPSEYAPIVERVPDCEFVVYEGLPHNITDAEPDRCARELHRFLSARRTH
jgi:pimeloyl-ACP methyl ester carboxylesterase